MGGKDSKPSKKKEENTSNEPIGYAPKNPPPAAGGSPEDLTPVHESKLSTSNLRGSNIKKSSIRGSKLGKSNRKYLE